MTLRFRDRVRPRAVHHLRAASTAALLALAVPAQSPTASDVETAIARLFDDAEARDAQVFLLRQGTVAIEPLCEALATGWRNGPDLASQQRGETARARVTEVLLALGPTIASSVDGLQLLAELPFDPYVPDDVAVSATWILCRAAAFHTGTWRALRDRIDSGAESPTRNWAHKAAFAHFADLQMYLEFDAAAATVDELLDHVRGDHVYARATACRALRHRADSLGDRRREVVEVLRTVALREVPRGARLDWKLTRWRQTWRADRANVLADRTEVALALAALAPDDPAALLGHCQNLYHIDPDLRREALERLTRLGNGDALEWLIPRITYEPERDLRLAVLRALPRFGSSAPWHAERLVQLLPHGDPETDRAVRTALHALRPDIDLESPATPPRVGLVATHVAGVDPIDEDAERARLLRWLDADDGAERRALQRDPLRIARFLELGPEDGGRLAPTTSWCPRRIGPDVWRPGFWDPSWSEHLVESTTVSAAPEGACGPQRERLDDRPWIIELVLVDRGLADYGRKDLAVFRPERDAIRIEVAARLLPALNEARAILQRPIGGSPRGGLALVVDGVAVGVHQIDTDHGADNPNCGLGIDPAAWPETWRLRDLRR